MKDILIRIKRAVLAGRIIFSDKARVEMEADHLSDLDIVESIANAVAVYKRLRSRSPHREAKVEYLYVTQSANLEGLMIYCKGKLIRSEAGADVFYFLISSKLAT